jgi:membrane-bound lytic murein transglycosylase B
MVKPFVSTLAMRMMRSSQVMQVHLTRIQSGFMPERNIQEAEQLLQEMQAAIQEIRTAISSTDTKQASNCVPLK